MSSGQQVAIQVFRLLNKKNDEKEKIELRKLIAELEENSSSEDSFWDILLDFLPEEKIEMLKTHPALSNKTISWLLLHQ